jgi:hypothetical protein
MAEQENRPPEGAKRIDTSTISAPSIGPNTVIEREPPEARLARHQQSDIDAMGKDKRRQVVGHSYGPSRRQQLTFFGIVGALVLVVWLGAKIMVSEFDQPPAQDADKAPWSQPDAQQTPPARPF